MHISQVHVHVQCTCTHVHITHLCIFYKAYAELEISLILVEGAPGIGKTTFAWKVCRKWAKGKILNEYGLVVLLRLRDKRVREVKCVADLFYHSDPELQSSVAREIQ